MVASSRPSLNSTPSSPTVKPKTPSSKYPPICLCSQPSAGGATRSRRSQPPPFDDENSGGVLVGRVDPSAAQTNTDLRPGRVPELSSATVPASTVRVSPSPPATLSAAAGFPDLNSGRSSASQAAGHLKSRRPSSSTAAPRRSVPLHQSSSSGFESSVHIQVSDLSRTPGACRNAAASAASVDPTLLDSVAAGATVPVQSQAAGAKPGVSFSNIVRGLPTPSFIRNHSAAVAAFGAIPDCHRRA